MSSGRLFRPGWGNGKAAAVAYAREGARVVAIDLSLEAAEETAHIIESEGGSAIAVACDVLDLTSVEAAVATSIETFGRLDILHNNVGAVAYGGPVELDEEAFAAISISMSVRSIAPRSRDPALSGGWQRRDRQHLIARRRPLDRLSLFCLLRSKAAVNQATVALALQYARSGIRANAVMPGAIDTPLIYKQISSQYADVEEMVAARNAMIPMGQMGTAWDVAAAAVFLASDDAKFITGVTLPVDGGQSCAMG